MKQMTFADAEYAGKHKQTCKAIGQHRGQNLQIALDFLMENSCWRTKSGIPRKSAKPPERNRRLQLLS